MAGAGYKLFATGDVLTAAQVNTYLNEQTVMVFADSAARTAALSGVLAEGMVSYLQDTNAVEVYNGSNWVGVGNVGDITEVQAGVGISVASGTGPIPVITNSSTDLITTAGDLLYGTAADTVARLEIGTAGHVLKVNSGATAPEWAVDPTTDVVTTAGDLIYGTGADAVTRLGIGTAGQVLKVNSGATAPEWGAAGGGGKVLQVVQGTHSTDVSNTSTTYTDSGLSVSITPSAATSKILLLSHMVMKANRPSGGTNYYCFTRLMRDATEIADHILNRLFLASTSVESELQTIDNYAHLDSPATTSAITYKIQIQSGSTDFTATAVQGAYPSNLIALEIGA